MTLPVCYIVQHQYHHHRQQYCRRMKKDISDRTSQFSIDGQRLYNLINSDEYGQHVITVDVRGKGF